MPTLNIDPTTIWRVDRHASPSEINALFGRREAPTLATISDAGLDSSGPTGWPTAGKILRWARAVEIQIDGAGINESASKAAQRFRRVLVIQTIPKHAAVWRMAAEFAGVRRFLPLAPVVREPLKKRGAA